MRNRYLDLQKKKMQEFKKHLYKARFSQANYEEKNKKSQEITEEVRPIEESVPKLEFVAGVIVKVHLAEPLQDPKVVKVIVQ